MTFLIDMHEPAEAYNLISPAVDECMVVALNENNFADYAWDTQTGMVHVERKQWGEVLGGLDKVEEQLRLHMARKPDVKLVFLLEGMATPVLNGTAQLKSVNNGRLYAIGRESTMRMSAVYAWLYQVSKFVEVYQTSNYESTCIALVAMYKGDQKEEHGTFQRHFKKVEIHPNPQVTMLMNLLVGVGEKRAVSLIREYATVWNVISATPQELARVDGITEARAKEFLARIGRVDV